MLKQIDVMGKPTVRIMDSADIKPKIRGVTSTRLDWMRLDSALKKSRPQYISAQNISTLFDALDEREIVK